MLQASRNSNLKIPKQIEIYEKNSNSIDDTIAIKKAIATANNEKVNSKVLKEDVENDDKELNIISKIPSNSNDLIVITVVKKLGAYIIAVTEKSPKKFRGVFVNRMQNYCLDTLEFLLEANFIRVDCLDNKKKERRISKKCDNQTKNVGVYINDSREFKLYFI